MARLFSALVYCGKCVHFDVNCFSKDELCEGVCTAEHLLNNLATIVIRSETHKELLMVT